MSRVSFPGWRKDNVAHIEIDSCIVNIRTGLSNSAGKVEVISVIPTQSEGWDIDGEIGIIRVIKKGAK